MTQRQLGSQNLEVKENSHTLTILVSYRITKELEIKSNKLEVSDTAGTSSTPKTGGIHGNYVDYVILQFSITL